ncbi:MAG: helix-turn-helix transcriptional regulator [Mesorhizobium sp.]|nr:MAG: helix-turn-helix transcriptional regulator [Mesorhizobium sp.]
MLASDFVEAFSATVGIAPEQWLALLRVDQAKDYLRDRRLTTAEIAARCGFADELQFNDTFLKQTGMTPGDWRRGLYH